MKPVNAWIIAKPIDMEEESTPSGLVLAKKPGSEEIKKATVTQISEDIPRFIKQDDTQPDELPYKVGDTVVYFGKTGINFSVKGEKFVFLKYDGMLAID